MGPVVQKPVKMNSLCLCLFSSSFKLAFTLSALVTPDVTYSYFVLKTECVSG